MRVKEAASIVVNMPKKKHKQTKKNRVLTDTSGRIFSFLCLCNNALITDYFLTSAFFQ